MLPEQQIILRLLVSAVLGSVVGLERERLNWVAGLRTHMLVCVGSILFMIVAEMHGAQSVQSRAV
jgi:putative Mg2+ transporter-C (MgtC) family protein